MGRETVIVNQLIMRSRLLADMEKGFYEIRDGCQNVRNETNGPTTTYETSLNL